MSDESRVPTTVQELEQSAARAETGDFSGLETIVAALTDPNPDLRIRAAYLAERIGGPSAAVEPLCRMATSDPESDNRNQAMYALTAIGRPAAVDPLIEALGDDEPERRADARVALYRLLGMDALRALGDEEFGDAQDPEEQARFAAWWQEQAASFDPKRAYAYGKPASPEVFIDQLDTTQTPVPDALYGALHEWTGEDFGASPGSKVRSAWRRWWAKHRDEYEPGKRYFRGHPVP